MFKIIFLIIFWCINSIFLKKIIYELKIYLLLVFLMIFRIFQTLKQKQQLFFDAFRLTHMNILRLAINQASSQKVSLFLYC